MPSRVKTEAVKAVEEAAALIVGPPATVIAPDEYRLVALEEVKVRENVRRHFDPVKLEELTESVRKHGVLQPILVRPVNGHLEVVAGERRLRAAKLAGLERIPAAIREMSADTAIEIQLVENLRRADLHAMEEAEGYAALERKGRTVAAIAAQVGRSVQYVYGRLKLCSLIPEARKLFLEDLFTPGHAVLLATLGAKDQARAIRKPGGGYYSKADGLFVHDGNLFRKPGEPTFKAVSVAEFDTWIREHVKFDRHAVDPMLFPDTAETLKKAEEEERLKPVPITEDSMAGHDVRGSGPNAERIYGANSWKRAEGRKCDWSRIGVVVEGKNRGASFRVCVNRQKCEVHWAKEVKARKAREAAAGKAGPAKRKPGEDQRAAEDRRRKEQEAAAERERERWDRAMPALKKAVEGAVAWALKDAPTLIVGALKSFVVYEIGYGPFGKRLKAAKSVDDVLAVIALSEWERVLEHVEDAEIVSRGQAWGIDVKKIVDEANPPEKPPAAAAPAGKPAGKKKAKP